MKIENKIVIETNDEKEIFSAFVDLMGTDKCNEYISNFIKVTKKEKITVKEFYDYVNYEYDLASILFVMLRMQEDLVKGFLANEFKGRKIDIEERESRYSKRKYYLKFPDIKNGGYLDIRTFTYEKGPIDYYDAIKYLDFGDINLIMSHLSNDYLEKFSNNKNIINELDQTRKIRNYVYHHNTLFSYGKKTLKSAIVLILRNLPTEPIKKSYINEIENLRYEGSDRKHEICEELSITFTKEELDEIFEIKPRLIYKGKRYDE